MLIFGCIQTFIALWAQNCILKFYENQNLVFKNKDKLDISVLEMVDDVVSDTKCSNKTALPYKFLQLHF